MRELERQIRTLSSAIPSSAALSLNRPGPVCSHEDVSTPNQTEFSLNPADPSIIDPLAQRTPNLDADFRSDSVLRSSRSTAVSSKAAKSVLKEVTSINRHTKNVEFYGSSSSLAFLSRVQVNDKVNDSSHGQQEEEESGEEGSLVSKLHNSVFFPSPASPINRLKISSNSLATHNQHCRTFIENFFGSIHYIHPVLAKSSFLARCERLWSSGERIASKNFSKSFMALYFSVLSFAALVEPKDEESGAGDGNVEWSTKFFDEARVLCAECSMTTNLDMVQCFFYMVRPGSSFIILLLTKKAQTCQYMLNPHRK